MVKINWLHMSGALKPIEVKQISTNKIKHINSQKVSDIKLSLKKILIREISVT